MSKLKVFDVGLGQYCEDGSPCVVAFDADRNPRLLNEKVYLKSEADKVIAELEDKCQMHDFFWEGCGFAKRGFKNSIAVSEAFDSLEADNAKLKDKLRHYPMMAALIDSGNKEIRHHKYKRCLAMAEWCAAECVVSQDTYKRYSTHKSKFRIGNLRKWHKRWLELAEKFKEAK